MPLIATKGAASAQGFGEFAQSAAVNYIEDVFSTYLYTGNSSTQTITNNIDLSTKGGMVWLKNRGSTSDNGIYDTTRGANNVIYTNLTNAQSTLANSLTAFGTTGFTLGTDSTYNFSADTLVSWTFREQPKFFDIVTYTGTGSPRTVAHNLGSAPGCIIIKRYDSTGSWAVWHRSGTQTNGKFAAFLDSTGAYADQASNYWGSETNPPDMNATTFGVGTAGDVNSNGFNYVAYLFAHDAGGFGLTGSDNVITCGSYTGNGSTSGPTVTLGYEPQWLMIKNAGTTGSWQIIDNMRGMVVSGNDQRLIANSSSAELSNDYLSPTATGFTLVSSSSEVNGNGNTMIYIAIRRGPMKTPTSGTSVFYPKVHAGSSSYAVGFPTDLCISGDQSGNALNSVVVYRLAGNNKYFGGTASTAAEQTVSVCQFDLQNSFQLSYNNNNQARWHFKRAPGFFDVVCYTGNGTSGRTVTHNLTVEPQMMWVKARSASGEWWNVYTPNNKGAGILILNSTSAYAGSSAYWNNTNATSSVFTVGSTNEVNASGVTYVAYLFATVAGVSKVGFYTGTGSTQTIDCGFTAGSRFVMIKRSDNTGDWYVWDSARGIVAGNDPYLLLNSTAAEVTNTDYIDTANSGFEISSTAPAAINANGGTFIFFAVA